MKTSFLKFLSLLSIFFISSVSVKASHVMAVDVTYTCLGNNEYEFTVTVYRDCAGSTLGTNQTLNFKSASCNLNFKETLSLESSKEVSAVCSTSVSKTTCNSLSGTIPGTEAHTYKKKVTMPASCNDWIVSWSNCCRNSAITNLTSPGSQSLYIEVSLDNTNNLCNNSPQYASLPVPYICSNQQFTYNHGAYDVDGDSLVYELSQPLTTGGNPINYTSGYTINDPVKTSGGFNFNKQTGEMCFVPSQQQICVVSVKILEYRKGVLIATHYREMQVIVSSVCSNLPPTIGTGGCGSVGSLTNLQGGSSVTQLSSNVITMCPDDSLSFDMVGFDPNNDFVTMSSNIAQSIPGATITVDSNGTSSTPTATFNWIPTAGDTGVSVFTLTLADNACPILGTQNFNFVINVTVATSAGKDQVICGPSSEFPGVANLHAVGGNKFTWSVISGEPILVGTNFSCDTCQTTTASPSITTTYEVVSDLNAACKNRDTVTVFVVPDFTFSTTQSNDSICLLATSDFSVTPNPAGTYTYDWYAKSVFSNDSSASVIGLFDTPGVNTVYFDIVSSDGCLKSDTFTVVVSNAIQPKVDIVVDTTVCLGDSVQFQLINSSLPADCDYELHLYDDFGDGWGIGKIDFKVNGVATPYTVTTGTSAFFTITVKPGDLLEINYTGSFFNLDNSYYLIASDGDTLFSDGIGFFVSPKTGKVWTGTASCPPQGFSDASYSWTPNIWLSNSSISNPWAAIQQDTTYTVVVKDTIGGCSDTASVKLYLVPSFNFTVSQSDDTVCYNETVQFDVTPDVIDTYTYQWTSLASINDDDIKNPVITFDTSGTIYNQVIVSSSSGCDKYETVAVVVSPGEQPNLKITGDSVLCDGESAVLTASNKNGSSTATYNFTWSPSLGLSATTIPNPTASPTATTAYTVIAKDAIGGCADTTKVTVTVSSIPTATINNAKDKFCTGDNIFTFIGSPSLGGTWSGSGINTAGVFNPGTAGQGSHKLTYSVTQNGCTGTADTLVNVYSNPAAPSVAVNNPNCEGLPITSITANGSGGTILWFSDVALTNEISSIANYTTNKNDTIYAKELSTEGCESTSSQLIIQIVKNPNVSFTANPETGVKPLSVTFTNTSSPDSLNYFWNIANVKTSGSTNESFTFEEPGVYTVVLQATDSNGCFGVDSMSIIVDDQIVVPNVFTPNKDNVNDIFKIHTKALGEFTITVFNRWGKKVYGPCTGTPDACVWDGNNDNGIEAPAGTYYYVITGNDVNGKPIEQDNFTGNVTLIRDK